MTQDIPDPLDSETTDATVCLRVMVTTDVHGHILPFDYFTQLPDQPCGLARIATLVRQARDEAGAENCILLDNGDFLQGTALSDLTAQPGQGWRGRHPVLRAMNLMGYDAGTLGNHEFNFGLDWLQEALQQATFPLTCANAVTKPGARPDEDETFLPPYVILTRDLRDRAGALRRVRIGVLGLTPPQITKWDHAHLSGRLQARDMLETARAWIPVIRAAGADVIIALAHSGIEDGPERPMMENAARALSRIPGIDVICAGHSHRIFPGPDHRNTPGADIERSTLHGTPCLKPGFAGSHLGQFDLELTRVAGAWRIADYSAMLKSAADAVPSSTLIAALARAHAHTRRLTDQVLGVTTAPLHSYLALARNDPATQLINDAQRTALEAALRDTPHGELPLLSAAAPFKTGGRGGSGHYSDIAAGPLRLGNIADLYGFPNMLCGLLVTGADLRDWLERAAICFNQITPGRVSQPLFDPHVPGHHFDVIDGLSYRIDLAQPPRYDLTGTLINPKAQRIRELRHAGRLVRDQDRFIVATNTYRAWGGGPFQALAAQGAVHHGSRPIRDLIADHVAGLGTLTPQARDTWHFADLPETWAEIATGPGLRAHPQEIAALGATDLGLIDTGVLRLRVPLFSKEESTSLANPDPDDYVAPREVGAGRHLANPVRSGRKQP